MTDFPANPTLEQVIAKQTELKLGDDHLAYISTTGFHLAHSDPERLSEMRLSDCALHRYLEDEGWDIEPGWYRFATGSTMERLDTK